MNVRTENREIEVQKIVKEIKQIVLLELDLEEAKAIQIVCGKVVSNGNKYGIITQKLWDELKNITHYHGDSSQSIASGIISFNKV